MKAFIWQNVRNVSTSYHSGGGVLIVAESLEAARARFKAELGPSVDSSEDQDGNDNDGDVYTSEPDRVLDLVDGQEPLSIMVFKDAGCC